MMVNTNALERMAQLCHEDALENYIDLCEKTTTCATVQKRL